MTYNVFGGMLNPTQPTIISFLEVVKSTLLC